jgi:hypothetical protein
VEKTNGAGLRRVCKEREGGQMLKIGEEGGLRQNGGERGGGSKGAKLNIVIERSAASRLHCQ